MQVTLVLHHKKQNYTIHLNDRLFKVLQKEFYK